MTAASMVDAGTLHMRVRLGPQGLEALDVRNERPAAMGALEGRTAAEVLARVPRLFSLCGVAQAAAARAALEAATVGAGAARAGDEIGVVAETAQEHLWRLMLDWPALLALPEALRGHWHARFITLHRQLATLHEDACGEVSAMLSAAVNDVATPLLDAIGDNTDPPLPGFQPVPLLPALDAHACSQRLALGPGFERQPALDGQPHETGALARHADDDAVQAHLQRGERIRARVAARLADLAECAQALAAPPPTQRRRIDACSPGAGVGLASVASARGLLIHRVQFGDGDRYATPHVARYCIVAPTEWNFHPDGAFMREARAAAHCGTASLRHRLRALALALDPCVAVRWTIEETQHA